MIKKQTIYISSYPRSGSTWCTRLLADILSSPSGGCMPKEDRNEIATEGQKRPGSYIVRKGHFVLVDNKMQGGRFRTVDDKVVPVPHRLNWENITDEKIVLLVRDPRDVCVSGAFHWQQPIKVFLDRMIKGDVAKCGRWDRYYNKHLNSDIVHFLVRYEDLLERPIKQILDCIKELDLKRPETKHIREAIIRQSFARKKKRIGDDPKELRRHNMRKGIAGDWHNHFTPQMNSRIWNEFGWIMERLGYEK